MSESVRLFPRLYAMTLLPPQSVCSHDLPCRSFLIQDPRLYKKTFVQNERPWKSLKQEGPNNGVSVSWGLGHLRQGSLRQGSGRWISPTGDRVMRKGCSRGEQFKEDFKQLLNRATKVVLSSF